MLLSRKKAESDTPIKLKSSFIYLGPSVVFEFSVALKVLYLPCIGQIHRSYSHDDHLIRQHWTNISVKIEDKVSYIVDAPG